MAENKQEPKLDATKLEYIKAMEAEKEEVTGSYPHALRLLSDEIDRVQTGRELNKLVEVHHPKPSKLSVKVLIPVKQFPKYNFVGKLLGPKGNSLKRLQDDTGCKMAILGKGSMRDQNKEEECRKEGGKFAHLNDDLHVLVDAFGLPGENHSRMAHAMSELQRFLTPDNNDEIRQQQFEEMMFLNGDQQPGSGGRGGPGGSGRGGPPRGRGGGRGRGSAPPPPRGGGRGGAPRGGGSGGPLLATPAGRSMPPPAASRGGPPPRGGGRGGPGAGRAPPPAASRPAPRAPAPRAPAPLRDSHYEQDSGYYASPPPQQQQSSYAEDSYGSYDDATTDYQQDPYSQPSYSQQAPPAQSEPESYDYGHGHSYSAEESYGDSWSHGGSSYGKAPAARTERAQPQRSLPQRAHPYSNGGAQRSSRY